MGLNKLLLWFMLRFKPVSKPALEIKPYKTPLGQNTLPVVLLTIGELTVYHLQTNEEFIRNDPPKGIYWQNKSGYAFGPFTSIYKACDHYSYFIEQQKIEKSGNKMIHVDFIKKKRR
jgi:hypothetical protein